jgi:hypothetical protein
MIIGIYFYDCLVLGKEKDINQLIVDLKFKGFALKSERDLKDYLSWIIPYVHSRFTLGIFRN